MISATAIFSIKHNFLIVSDESWTNQFQEDKPSGLAIGLNELFSFLHPSSSHKKTTPDISAALKSYYSRSSVVL